MGKKKKKKEKVKPRAVKKTGVNPIKTTDGPLQPEHPDLSHLSGDWQEFYRLVIERIS